MNTLIQMGRLTKDPESRETNAGTVTRFSVAVDRRYKKDTSDFFNYTTFGKTAEFARDYLRKGTKVLISGRVENNNYTDKDGRKVYGFQFVAEEIEFAESKKAAEQQDSGFVTVPDDVDDENLPFN